MSEAAALSPKSCSKTDFGWGRINSSTSASAFRPAAFLASDDGVLERAQFVDQADFLGHAAGVDAPWASSSSRLRSIFRPSAALLTNWP